MKKTKKREDSIDWIRISIMYKGENLPDEFSFYGKSVNNIYKIIDKK